MMRDRPGQASGLAAEPIDDPTLVWERADGSRQEYALAQSQPISLGRDASNTIVLDSGFVSKRHAVVRYEGGQFIIEDLKSANGTRLNGSPVSISLLTPGDVLEVGDQTLRFIDKAGDRKKRGGSGRGGSGGGSGAEASPAAKLARLGAVALIFGGGLFMMLRFMVLGGGANVPPPLDMADTSSGARWTIASKTPPALSTKAPIVQRVLETAKTAGVNPNDALFDEAKTQYGGGRLLDAARLFAAVVERDPSREIAKARLEEARNELESAIARHRAEAERMSSQLRYDDAAAEWEQVLLLLEPDDARVAPARAGLAAAQRLAKR